MYKHLYNCGEQVEWKRLIFNSKASPKSTFIGWLAIQNKLATKDILLKWNFSIDGKCGLCQLGDETPSHLFFSCQFSQEVWSLILQNLGVGRSILPWNDEVQRAVKKSRRSKNADCSYSIAFLETVYSMYLAAEELQVVQGSCLSC
ncbi:uncharacterized protein [Spinacia oleracea]|uniref:Reverse transcriptase zinc-binding domain-containing protein n=1 Tax=Spinacia oleracea TaxID=3562 RepID=A0A9R0HRT3_SPIOL|nr:uncharacterized protein LOC110775516 [Spinacia oleracea]